LDVDTQEMARRIDALEALVNGLMIYIAAKEAGIELDDDSADTKTLVKDNLYRQSKHRLSNVGEGDGFNELASIGRIQELVAQLRTAG
jgi:hypothetical protein